jgi:hypothetical protein
VLEAGRRFTHATFPIRSFLWAPKPRRTGIQRVHLLGNVAILGGAGVGGGSLNYADTRYEPAPVANRAARQLADTVGGVAGGTWGDLMKPSRRRPTSSAAARSATRRQPA